MTVDQIIQDIIDLEGGFVDNPDDRGGPTNFGVTLATFRAWRETRASIDELRDMEMGEAHTLLKTLYFFQPNINLLDPTIQAVVSDSYVMSGPHAIRDMQKAINKSAKIDILVDGVIGPVTARASITEAMDRASPLITRITVARSMRLARVVAANRRRFKSHIVTAARISVEAVQDVLSKDRDQSRFLAGWMARSLSFL